MKTFLAAAVIIGLTGTTLIAAPAEPASEASRLTANPNLPSALMEKLKALQAKNPAVVPPVPNVSDITAFLKDTGGQIKTSAQQINKLLQEKGYDPNFIALADYTDSYVITLKKELEDLNITALESLNKDSFSSLIQTTANNRGILDGLMKILKEYQPIVPDTFPGKCYNYDTTGGGKSITGFIDISNRQWNFISYENDKVTTYSFSPDVGLIHQGQELVISRTPNGMVETAWLGADNKVVCVSKPYKPAIPLKKPLIHPRPIER